MSPLNVVLLLMVALLIGVVFYEALVSPPSANGTVTSTATSTATTTETVTGGSLQTFTTSTTATLTSVSTGSTTLTVTSTTYSINTSTETETLATTTTITTIEGASIPPAAPPYSATQISCSPSMKNCTLTLVNAGAHDVTIETGVGCASITTGGVTTLSSQCISANGNVVPARGTSSITITFAPNAFPGVSVGQEFVGWIVLSGGVQVPLLGTFGQ